MTHPGRRDTGRIDPQRLRDFATTVLERAGVASDDAALVADSLVQADLWGHQSHGLMRLFWYVRRIENRATRADSRPRFQEPGDGRRRALATLDGGDGIGQVMAHAAMLRAIDAAKDFGIGIVPVRRSGHFGMAMYFTRLAAQAGCIGFLTSNASPAMAPWGGTEKRVGNNPWSWAAPAGHYPPMILDIANTAVARGKLYLARQRGEPIPDHWAIDAQGRPTTDPQAGIDGTIQPMAGHKGYAISTLMDVVAGVLPGSAFGSAVTGPYMPQGASGVGHCALAVDIEAVRPLANFEADMERLIAQLKATPRAPGVAEIRYPGEIEAMEDARNREHGLALPADTLAELAREAGARGIAVPF